MKKSWFVILLLPILAWAAQSPFDGDMEDHLRTPHYLKCSESPE